MFALHRGNLAELWCLHNNFNAIEILPRQNYKTVSAAVFYGYQYDFGTSNSTFLFVNKEYTDSKKNLKILKDTRAKLPKWLQLKTIGDQDNVEFIASARTGNSIRPLASANDTEGAEKRGRGMTSSNQWWDEFAFLKWNDIIYGAAAPAFSQAKIEAKSNNRCYSKLITTTPSNTDVPAGKFCKEMINNSAVFTEALFDMTKDEVEEYIKANSTNDFLYIEYNYKQLRRNKEWFEEQCRSLNNDMKLIRREILCQWTASADVSPFDEIDIVRVEAFQREHINVTMFLNKYPLYFYAPVDPNITYIISVDVSGGLDRDSTAVVVSHPEDLETIAVFRSAKMDTPDLEKFLDAILVVFPKAVYIIERNSYGLAVLQHIIAERPLLTSHLFYTVQHREDGGTVGNKRKIKEKGTLGTKTYGINTTGESRPRIIQSLKLMVMETPECFISKFIIDEIKTLEEKHGGKIEHGSGQCDDVVIAKAFAKYAKEFLWKDLKRHIAKDVAAIRDSMSRISRAQAIAQTSDMQLSPLAKEHRDLAERRVRPKPNELSKTNAVLALNTVDKHKLNEIKGFDQPAFTGLDWFGKMQQRSIRKEKGE
jgi:rRNA-processing protein FCF1